MGISPLCVGPYGCELMIKGCQRRRTAKEYLQLRTYVDVSISAYYNYGCELVKGCQLPPTILEANSSSMFLAAFTPTGSPSMRMQSFLSVSGGIMMEVPVSVLIRLTAKMGNLI